MPRRTATRPVTIAFYGDLENDRPFKIRAGAQRALSPGGTLEIHDCGLAADRPYESAAAPPWANGAAGAIVNAGTIGSTAAMADWVRLGSRATVATAGDLFGTDLPVVTTATSQLGKLAADHLGGECRCRSFVHLGYGASGMSIPRERGFREALAAAGHRLHALETDFPLAGSPGDRSQIRASGLASLLRRLPRPIGVLTLNDAYAEAVLMLCGELGMRVPADVAVLGVGNSELAQLQHPGISSIQIDYGAVGEIAMRTLLGMLDAPASRPEPGLMIPPGRVVARESTVGSLIAWRSLVVDRAMQEIRRRSTAGLSVTGLAGSLRVSPRLLELLFREDLDSTPRQEIQRVRFAEAMRLLRETDLPLTEVALRVGFAEGATLSKIFRRFSGRSPSAYRALKCRRGRGT